MNECIDIIWMEIYYLLLLQQTPVILAGNPEQKKKYLGRCMAEPIVTVSYLYLSESWRTNQ